MADNIGKETTFVMLYPYVIRMHVLGDILKAFEKKDLTITGLKYMSMRGKFVEEHFSRPERTPQCLGFSVESMSGATVVAVMLNGEGVIDKARAVQSGEWATTEYLETIHVHASLSEYCYRRDQTLALIMPVAFQKRRVGDIISVLEKAYLRLKGLKLLDSANIPASIKQSADSPVIDEDNFQHGVAMVLKDLMINSIQSTTEENVCYFDPDTKVVHYDSKLVYIAESVERARELTVRFFPDGFVLFPESGRCGMFEASLLGI